MEPGETHMLQFPDGTQLFFEQICHHPPITAFEVVGPPEAPFHAHGRMDFTISISPFLTHLVSKILPVCTVHFPNGDVITVTTPNLIVTGIVSLPRVLSYTGKATFEYPKHCMSCSLWFGKPVSTWGQYFFGGAPPRRHDHFAGDIWQETAAIAASGTKPSSARLRKIEAWNKVSASAKPAGTAQFPIPAGASLHPVALPPPASAPSSVPTLELVAPTGLANTSVYSKFLAKYRTTVPALYRSTRLDPTAQRDFPPYLGAATTQAVELILAKRRAKSKEDNPWMARPPIKSRVGETERNQTCIATITGNFATHMMRDYEMIWDVAQTPLHRALHAGSGVLPSDSRYRPDRMLLQAQRHEEALA